MSTTDAAALVSAPLPVSVLMVRPNPSSVVRVQCVSMPLPLTVAARLGGEALVGQVRVSKVGQARLSKSPVRTRSNKDEGMPLFHLV